MEILELKKYNPPHPITVYSKSKTEQIILEGKSTITVIKDSDEPIEVTLTPPWSGEEPVKLIQYGRSQSYYSEYVPNIVFENKGEKDINVTLHYINTFRLFGLVNQIFESKVLVGIKTDGVISDKIIIAKITDIGWPIDPQNQKLEIENSNAIPFPNYIHTENHSLYPDEIIQIWNLTPDFKPEHIIYQRDF